MADNVSATPDPVPLQSADVPGSITDSSAPPATPAVAPTNNPGLSQPSQPAAPPAPPPDPSQHVEQAHDSALGKMMRSLMGSRMDYKTDPKTGQVVATPVKNTPGQFFRGILAGAIMGGLAGGKGTTFKEGAALGAEKEQETAVRRDQTAYARAEQANKDSMEKKRLDNELTLQQAQIAHMHNEDVRADAQMDIVRQDHIDEMNKYNDTLSQGAVSVGGVESPILVGGKNINAQQGNGRAVMEQYTKDPRAFDAPQGYHRIHTQKVDYDGLKYKAGTGWVAEDGKPVDMSTRTTHSFYDVPQNAWQSPVQVSGKEINDLVGSKVVPEDSSKTMTFGDMVNLKQKSVHDKMESAKADKDMAIAKRQANLIDIQIKQIKNQIDKGDRADLSLTERSIRDQMTSLNSRLKDAQFDPELKTELLGQLSEADDALGEVRKQLGFKVPEKKIPKPDKPGQPLTTDIAKLYLRANGNDIDAARKAAAADGWAIPTSAGAPPAQPATVENKAGFDNGAGLETSD